MRAAALAALAAARRAAPASASARWSSSLPPREALDFDVVVVGAGPAGLAAALQLKKRAAAADVPVSVAVIDKAASPGAHTLSGAVVDPGSLTELLGDDWISDAGAAAGVPVTRDRFYYLTGGGSKLRLPTPPLMKSKKCGARVVSLSELVRHLADKAEAAGVDILPGFAAVDTVTDAAGAVVGVVTGDVGIGKDGKPRAGGVSRGVELRARATLIAEGCRGSLAERVMARYNLRADAQHQTYALGLKEVWSVEEGKHSPGEVWHTIGHPLDAATYGGGFVYHMGGDGNRVSVGLIVGLDYPDPSLNLYQEFQRFKAHPAIASLLRGASPRAYGARTLNEGGWQSLPQLAFPGGALLGCAAGTLVVPRLKGTHTAVKSGALAADVAFERLKEVKEKEGDNASAAAAATPLDMSAYDRVLRESWVGDELRRARNVRPGFKHGLWPGLAAAAVDTLLLRGGAPWTLSHGATDRAATRTLADAPPPRTYPPPDGDITFALPDALARSGTDHEPNQRCHLTLKNPGIPAVVSAPLYGGPEARFCPAGVYEYYDADAPEGAAGPALSTADTAAAGARGAARLRINAQNCLHCKACDIKDAADNIVWTVPEGGGGPQYTET